MSNKVLFKIDGKKYTTEAGTYIVDAAKENNIYIPTLCNYPGVKPRSSCRICSIKVSGRIMTACTVRVSDGMEIEVKTPELEDFRKAIIELLFVEGNHFCPSCEKSGRCDLQALGYRYDMIVPRFKYMFPQREPDAENSKLFIDHNRCILCKRCIRLIKDKDGKKIFGFKGRGVTLSLSIDHELAAKMTDEQAEEAMEICPVGVILKKGKGFDVPIGKRKYDKTMIGSDVESKIAKFKNVR